MSKIFDNVVDVENYLGISVSIPSDIPEDVNVLCYDEDGEQHYLYKENQDSLQYTGHYIGGGWGDTGSKSLEEEVEWDVRNGYKFAYLRLATKDNSDVFAPERLLGVETNKGFITNVVEIGYLDIMNPSYYVYTTESLSKEDLYDAHNIKFFISNDNDETASFNEYIELFYEG